MIEAGSISEPFESVRGSHPRYVLIVCYEYPMIWADGIIRTYQFAKQLPRFGWHPIILTSQLRTDRDENIETSDGPLLCPMVTVPRSRVLVPYQTDHQGLFQSREEIAPKQKGALEPLAKFARELPFPDGKIGWLPAAVRGGLRIAREYPPEMCYSVSPRPTAHLVARRLARLLGIPWVADFALPWSDAYWLTSRPRFIGWLDRQLQGSVLASARHITVAYPDIERGICARYGAAWQKKISVIPTGFDDDLFGQETLTAPSKFTILYPGHHFCEESRHGDSFLKAVDEWVDSDTRLKNRVDFVFIGKRDEELVRRRTAMRHSKVIRLEPLISHRACIRAIISSNVCVVNAVGNRIPVKVYECMRAGKWLLALTPPGSDLDRLVGRYSRGISVPPQDISSIRNALQALFHLRDSGEAEGIEVDSFLDQYSSRHNAARICRIFEDALDPRERRTAAASHA